MRINKIIKYEFEDGNDIEFVPQGRGSGHQLWVCGVHVETLLCGERPTSRAARYFHAVYCSENSPALTAPLVVVAPH